MVVGYWNQIFTLYVKIYGTYQRSELPLKYFGVFIIIDGGKDNGGGCQLKNPTPVLSLFVNESLIFCHMPRILPPLDFLDMVLRRFLTQVALTRLPPRMCALRPCLVLGHFLVDFLGADLAILLLAKEIDYFLFFPFFLIKTKIKH